MFDTSLEDLPPGPELAAALATCDLSEMSDGELLDVARAAQRLAAWAESRQLDAAAAFADHRCPHSGTQLSLKFDEPLVDGSDVSGNRRCGTV
jgi:hypothetical protein